MAVTKFYGYAKCSTCRNAEKFLKKNKISYESLPIVEQPPSISELKKMLGYLKANGGELKDLFNTSGEMYRELKMSEKLKAGLPEDKALKLLSENGKLIKRPFVLTPHSGIVGFKEDAWKDLF